MVSLLVLVLAALLVVAGLVLLRWRGSERVTAADVVWLLDAPPGSPVRQEEAEVAVRYLVRHRTHRLVGGLVGVAAAVVVGLRWYQEVGIGVVERSPLADVLFCGVAGVLLGALAAETHRLAPAPGARSASLAPRPPAPLGRTVLAARLVLAAAALGGAALLAVGAGTAALASAAAGALVVGTAELTRRRVVDRRRLARSERVDRLDGRLRAFAATSVARLELAAAVLTATYVLAWWRAATPQAPTALALLTAVGGLAGLVVVVVLLVRAAPRAPRRARAVPVTGRP